MHYRSNTSNNQRSETKETVQQKGIQEICTIVKDHAMLDKPIIENNKNLEFKQVNAQQNKISKQQVDKNDDTMKKNLAEQIYNNNRKGKILGKRKKSESSNLIEEEEKQSSIV